MNNRPDPSMQLEDKALNYFNQNYVILLLPPALRASCFIISTSRLWILMFLLLQRRCFSLTSHILPQSFLSSLGPINSLSGLFFTSTYAHLILSHAFLFCSLASIYVCWQSLIKTCFTNLWIRFAGDKLKACYICHTYNNVWHPKAVGFVRGADKMFRTPIQMVDKSLAS